MLQNLNELVKPISEKLKKFNVLDCPLPSAFTENVKYINKCSIEYGHSASCVVNRNGQRIYLSNNWFYIAAILEPLNKPFHEYKNLLLEIVDKDVLKQSDSKRIRLAVNSRMDLSDQDKEYLLKFALEPLWWNGGNSNTGGKTLDRGDALVSAVLSIANLVNNSQSYVATLWEFFGDNPEYARMLAETADNLIQEDTKSLAYDGSSVFKTNHNCPEQIIYFGSPGTGKSRAVADYLDELIKNGKLKKENIFRTTFHPDYDFASFVGTYKPVMRSYSNIVSAGYTFSELADLLKKEYASSENKVATLHGFILKHIGYFNGQIARFNYKEFCQSAGLSETYYAEITKMVNLYDWMQDNNFITTNDSISYEFEPQVFTEAYVRAWEDTNERVYLVIEEINRGNCAQIFGDLFQLLDRKDGVSEYPVKADAALRKYLEKALLEGSTGIERGLLSLPPNFNIIATMNTSDQSLFPMDSAFKRRWNWKYMPTLAPTGKENILKYTLEQNRTQDNVTINAGDYEYKWTEFLDRINRKILKATGSEDKQLGFWFVKGQNGTNEISVSTFVSKVVFYLWNDVFKDVGPKEYNPFVCMTADQRRVIMPFNTFFELNPEGKVVENIGVLHSFLRNVGLLPFIKPAIADAQNKADSNGETFENE